MLFLLLGAVYGRSDRPASRPPTRCSSACVGYGCANTAFAGLAITLVIRREGGVLKRIRATPLPPSTYLAAVLCSTLFVFVLQMLRDDGARGRSLRRDRGRGTGSASRCAVLLGVAAFAGLGFGLRH